MSLFISSSSVTPFGCDTHVPSLTPSRKCLRPAARCDATRRQWGRRNPPPGSGPAAWGACTRPRSRGAHAGRYTSAAFKTRVTRGGESRVKRAQTQISQIAREPTLFFQCNAYSIIFNYTTYPLRLVPLP